MIARAVDGVRFVTPIASQRLRPVFEAALGDSGIADRFTLIDGESIDVMSAADVVLLASGTAALESALLQKPTVAAYKLSRLSAFIARLIGEALIPEIMQEALTAEALAEAVTQLLQDAPARAALSRRFATLRSELALGADQRAADAVIKLAT